MEGRLAEGFRQLIPNRYGIEFEDTDRVDTCQRTDAKIEQFSPQRNAQSALCIHFRVSEPISFEHRYIRIPASQAVLNAA